MKLEDIKKVLGEERLKQTVRLASPIEFDSSANGDGLRIVLWFQGCPWACKGCHNQETWDIDGGFEITVEEILEQVDDARYHKGVTFSGGEPLMQHHILEILMSSFKKMGFDIWLYSGNTYQNLKKDPKFLNIEQYVDTLVDGPFVEELLNLGLKYRGSSNQTIIDLNEKRGRKL